MLNFVFLLSLNAVVFAAEVDPVIVTAMRSTIEEKSFSKSTTVLSEENLEKSKVNTIGEALRNVPGVFMRQSGGIGKVTTISIRGGTGDQTLVMFDGVQPINSPTVDSADLANLFNYVLILSSSSNK